MRSFLFSVIFILGIGFLSCNKEDPMVNDPMVNEPIINSSLINKWELLGYDDKSNNKKTMNDETYTYIFIEFVDSTNFIAKSLCTDYIGNYELKDNNRIFTKSMKTTQKNNSNTNAKFWDYIFRIGIGTAKTYSIKEDNLTLKCSAGFNLHFKKE